MIEIRVPELGGTVSECILTAWLKQPGEAVTAGEVVVEVTADKASLLLESPADGVLLAAPVLPGMVVPVGDTLGVVGTEGTAVPEAIRALSYPMADPERACRFHPHMDRPSGSVTPMNAMRAVLARRMVQSKTEAPHWYLINKVDMSGCLELRKRLKSEGGKATYNDMVIRAAALAMRQFPLVGAVATAHGVVIRPDIHIGFACAVTDEDLYVPVIRNADRLSLTDIGARSRELSLKAKQKRLLPADFVGGVLTVSNLGSYHADIFVPIVNPGESAIIGVGAIADEPRVVGGEVVVRPIMNMTLSCDHRVVDGVLGAKYSHAVRQLLENPERLLEDEGG